MNWHAKRLRGGAEEPLPPARRKLDLAFVFLRGCRAWLPAHKRNWADAMLSELAVIAGLRPRLRWAWSGSLGLGKIWARSLLNDAIRGDQDRRWVVTMVALYHAGFTAVLLGALAWQAPVIFGRPSWSEAVLPFLCMLFVAMLPAVIALGLWLMDDAARLLAIFFSLAHALGDYAWITAQHRAWGPRPVTRMVLDLAMIAALLLPSVKKAFRPPQLHLRLRDE